MVNWLDRLHEKTVAERDRLKAVIEEVGLAAERAVAEHNRLKAENGELRDVLARLVQPENTGEGPSSDVFEAWAAAEALLRRLEGGT